MMKRYMILGSLILLFAFSLWFFARSLSYKTPVGVPGEKDDRTVQSSVELETPDSKVRYGDIVNKNIFHPDRSYIEKPGEEAVVPEEPQIPQVMPALAVKGIVQNPEGEYIAYISVDGKIAQALRIGDRFENLKVVSITRTDVTIRWNNSDIKLSLRKIKSMGGKK